MTTEPTPEPSPPPPPEATEQVSALVPKTPTTTLAAATAAGYFGVPTDTNDDYIYTTKGITGIPKP